MFMPKKKVGCVWVPEKAIFEMIAEAKRTNPLETGGILMGYWVAPSAEAVIVGQVGPGPRATHRRYSFEPDYEWQEAEIARIYRKSHRQHTYLGDWHTHPSGTSRLSWKDLRAMREIAQCRDARVVVPIMALLSGASSWSLHMWSGEMMKISKWFVLPRVRPLQTKVY